MINNAKRIINYKMPIKPIKIIPILIKKMKTVRNTTIYQKITIISKNIPKTIRKS
jgi:predicted nucleic acid binding AN1-type Zn finger protein